MSESSSNQSVALIATPTPQTPNTISTLSQADLSDLVFYVVTGFGAEVTGEISSSWDKANNVLSAFIDSGSFRGDSAIDIEMSISLTDSGDVIGVYAQAMLVPGHIGITANIVPADVNSARKEIVKQAFYASDALDKVLEATTSDEVVVITLDALGYTDITGLSSSWNSANSTAIIVFDSATIDSDDITDAQIIFSVDTNGDLDTYSSSMLVNGSQTTHNLGNLNGAQKFVLEVANYSLTDISSIEEANNHVSLLTNNIAFELYESENNISQNLVINDGELDISESYSFDSIKLADEQIYTQSISISDAIDVLRHIVDLEAITEGSNAFHAADTDNNDTLNISDAIDILRHIVDLEAIDTFDLIDSEGNRVTELDANASGEAPTWTIVANGDVDMSGSFADDYLVSSELV